jgi:FkbM family methyltransferase
MGFVRAALERLSRGKVFWRRLPEPYACARVLVTPDAALSVLRWGDSWCDSELLRMVTRFVKTRDVVWDVGANLGVLGVAAAVKSGAGGRVLCVEPDLMLAQLIRKTAARLPASCARLDTLPVAVADASGIAEFHIAERGRASNALAQFKGRSQMGGVRDRQLVPVVRLDDLLSVSGPPSFVKIDVEGAEAVILDGGSRLLREARPIVYIEVEEKNAERVTSQFHEAAYDLFDPSRDGETMCPVSQCVWNTVAVPKKS